MRLEDMNNKYIENKFNLPPVPEGSSQFDDMEDVEDMYPLITFKFVAVILISVIIVFIGFYQLYKVINEGKW